MSQVINILLIDDSHTDGLLIEKALQKKWDQLHFARVDSSKEMKKALEDQQWDIILSDQSMPNFSAAEALQVLQDSDQKIPFIVVSGVVDMSFILGMGLLKLGVYDFVEKDDTLRLIPTIDRAISESNTQLAKQKAIKERDKSESKLIDLYENAPIAYFCVGVDGIISRCNKQAGILIGCSIEELVNHPILDLYADTPNGRMLAEKVLVDLRNGKEVNNRELQMLRLDGTVIWIQLSLNIVYDEQGNVLESRTVVVNINEQKLLEEQLICSQKMEALGTLAGGIAHDFNNMLAIIIGNAELLKYQVDEERGRERLYIEGILHASSRSAALVKQILAFSSANITQLEVVAFTHEVKKSLELHRATMPTSINLVKCISDLPLHILADKTQINQIMMNLISNAVDAMNENGELIVTVKEVNNEDFPQFVEKFSGYKSYAQLIVKDTGCGISKDNLERVFNPFFTTKDVGKGTGLGLSVVHTIVNNNGGIISINSKVDAGTSVVITFPLSEEPKGETATNISKNITPLKEGSGQILLVEDEFALANVYTEFLTMAGYNVSACNSGLDALKLFKKKPDFYDLVITDLAMPNMTGRQLSKNILEIRPDIPIIINTGHSDAMSREIADDIGICRYFLKPINCTELLSIVEECLIKNIED